MMIIILLIIAMVTLFCVVRALPKFRNHLILGTPFSGYFQIYDTWYGKLHKVSEVYSFACNSSKRDWVKTKKT